MEDVIVDLLKFAAIQLTVGGRLVYWVPTVTEDYQLEDIPIHPALRLVANSEQSFGNWCRRLITMEKTRKWSESDELEYHSRDLSSSLDQLDISSGNHVDREDSPSYADSESSISGNNKAPGHRKFRERYFAGFSSQTSSTSTDKK